MIRQRAGFSSPDAIPAHFKELGTGRGGEMRFINRYIYINIYFVRLSQKKSFKFSFFKRIPNSTGMHDIGQLARNSSPIFAQSGKSSFTLSEILPNVKRVLTVCKSSAGDSGKKARRLIAEALEMPFHTSLISRGVIFSFSRKS